MWMLEWYEEDGKREKRRGQLKLDRNGLGSLEIVPFAEWIIVGSRVRGGSDHGSFEWDIRWEGEFAGKSTLYGIYRVYNHRLLICFVHKGYEPPTRFVTTNENHHTLLVIRRLK